MKVMNTENEVVFISYEDATELVERITERAKNFNYEMHKNEMEAMAGLLSDCGVKVSDLINVSNLADNYAINAEIVGPSEAQNYNNIEENCLFQWERDGESYYCHSW